MVVTIPVPVAFSIFHAWSAKHAMPQNPALKGILLARHARSTLYS